MGKSIPVTTLFLDVGGVLLNNGWEHQSRRLAAEALHFDFDEMEARHHLIFEIHEEGKVTLQEYFKRILFYKKQHCTFEQVRDFMYAQSEPFPKMIECIQELKAQYNIKIAIVNNEAKDLNDYRIKKFKLDSFADFFISSCFVHLRKPDANILHTALNIAQVTAQQVVYIENTPMFVEVANELGIRSILHTDYLSTCSALADMGLHLD